MDVSIGMLPSSAQTPNIEDMAKKYLVTHSIDNQEQNRCVDIIQEPNGKFRFQEWRREPEDISGWFLMLDSLPKSYPCAEDAIAAAKQSIAWFKELDH
jgi:hypothetical protein